MRLTATEVGVLKAPRRFKSSRLRSDLDSICETGEEPIFVKGIYVIASQAVAIEGDRSPSGFTSSIAFSFTPTNALGR